MPRSVFSVRQFTPTAYYSAQDKANFANHFLRFVQKGCPWPLFHRSFYTHCSTMWGHIAHYNRQGFYATWFDSPDHRHEFLSRCLSMPLYGDPSYTWVDVERALRVWLKTQDLTQLAGYHQRIPSHPTTSPPLLLGIPAQSVEG